VKVDGGRRRSTLRLKKFRHLDHGYAVTSPLLAGNLLLIASSLTPTRANRESCVNDRMGIVAVSRAREDATIYTNSIEELRGHWIGGLIKKMALEAVQG